MADDFNFFDDDSLTPDWMRDSASDDASDEAPAGSIPPWETHGGSPPPPPGRTATAPPWETFRGAAPPPPQASGTLPPWGETSAPDEASMPFRGEPADDQAFDWGAPGETSAPAGDMSQGFTGTLPWREQDQPPAQESRRPIRRITESPPPAQPSAEDAGFLSGFGEAAGYDMAAPSGEDDDLDWLTGGTPAEPTADDLQALIFGDSSAAPEQPTAEDDFEAMFGSEFPEEEPVSRDDLQALIFGETPAESEPEQPAAEDDFEALFSSEFPGEEPTSDDDLEALIFGETPAEPEPERPAAQDDFEALFSSESPEEEPASDDDLEALIFGGTPQPDAQAPAALDDLQALFADESPEPEEEAEESDEFAWLDEDLGDLPVLAASPSESPAEKPEPARVVPEWLAAATFEDEEPEESEPAEEEAPRRAIHRIAPQAEEPEIDENDMGAWLARMGSDEPEQPGEMGEMTYEEWERLQAEKEREAHRTEEDRMLEEGPDWFSQAAPPPDQPSAAAPPPTEKGPDFVPDWFLGLEEQKQEETPDWFKKMDLSADALSAPLGAPPPAEPEPGQPATAAPDWFTGATLPGFDDTDWDAAFGPPPEEEKAPEPAPPAPIRRITPPAPKPADEVPEWADDSLREIPAASPAYAEEAPMSQDEFERPDLEPADEGEGVPDWLSGGAPEEPAPADEELPLPSTGMLYGFGGESRPPQQPEPEEISFEDEFALPDLEPEAGEVPDWLSQAAPEEPAPTDEELPLPSTGMLYGFDGERIPPQEPEPEEISFEDEFALPDLEPEAGEVPDWLSQAAPQEPEPEVQPEAELSLEDEFSLADFDLETDEVAPGEVPDWLTPGQDARAAPDEVPFPEIDLDDTMPTERPASAEEPSGLLESWMTDFEPGEGLRRPPRVEEEPEDFVERFEPLEPETYTPPPTAAPVDADAPDWLRELAAEGGMEEVSASETGLAGAGIPDFLATEAEMDWLGEISAEDVQAEPEPIEAADSMPPKPDESIPDLAPGTLHTAPLDSSAIDQLLGLYEPPSAQAPAEIEPVEPVEEAEAAEWAPEEAEGLFEERETEAGSAGEPAQAAPFEIGGVADWEWMTPAQGEAGQAVPDLGALFDEAAQGELAEMGDLLPPEAEPESLRPAPEAAPRFRRRKGEPEPAPAPQAAPGEPEHPEWIAEMRPSDLPVVVKAGGAETSIKQKQVIELPERLRAFHEKAMNEVRDLYEETAPPQPADAGPLAGIAGALSRADLVLETGVKPVEGLVVTPEQQNRLNRLQALLETVAAEEEELEEEKSQIEGLEPIDMEGYEAGEQPAPEVTPKRARRRRRFKLDRLIVGLLMLAALIAPFATDALHIATDPPALNKDGLAVGNAVDTLTDGQYALVAFEYGPAAAGELDPLAEAVLRDVLSKGAIPLTISTDPAGAFHAQAVIAPLVDDEALLGVRGQEETSLTAGEDYFLLRYLPGEAVGVRSLRTTSLDSKGNYEQHPAFKTDLRGDKTGLPVGNIERDIALIVVIGAESDAVRTWAEQLQDVSVPKVALVAAAIEPLTVPYVNKDGYAGYLAGVRDTYSYNTARNTADRTPYTMPADLPIDSLPDPEVSRWHSMALGAAAAAGLIALGMVLNLLRGITRRQPR